LRRERLPDQASVWQSRPSQGLRPGVDPVEDVTVPIRFYARAALRSLNGHEEGQTMVEYAVVLGMITVAIVAVFTALSGGISSALDAVRIAI
jgi:Flp pilus assembly pilin Flp